MLFGVIAIEAISALVLLGSFLVFADQAARDHARSNLTWTLSAVQQEALSFFGNAEQTVNAVVRLAETPVLDLSDQPLLRRYFFETLNADPGITGLFHADQDGRFVFVTRENPLLEDGQFFSRTILQDGETRRHDDRIVAAPYTTYPVGPLDIGTFDPRERPWYANALESDAAAWTEPYVFFSAEAPGITIARALRADAGRVDVVGADLSLLGISRFMEGLTLSPGSKVFLATPDGRMIAFPGYHLGSQSGEAIVPLYADLDDIVLRRSVEASGLLAANGDGDVQEAVFDLNGETHLAAFLPLRVGSIDWVIGSVAPAGDFIGWFDDVRTTTLGLVSVMAVLGMFAGWLLWSRVDRQLALIRQRADLFASHDPRAFDLPHPGLRELQRTDHALTAMAREIDRRQSQTRAVTERLEQIVTAVDHAPVAIAIFEPNGTVIYANPLVGRFLEMVHSTEAERAAYTDRDAMIAAIDGMARAMREDSNSPPPRTLAEAIEAGEPWEAELFDNDGGQGEETVYYAIAAPMGAGRASDGHTTWFLVLENATNRHRTEHALIAAAERAESASMAKSQFLASMSHELRTPLNSILGFSDLILNEALGPLGNARYREYIVHIREGGRRLLELVTNILDMTAVESGHMSLKPGRAMLREIASRAIAAELALCEKSGTTVVNRVPAAMEVHADAFKLERVLANLVQNAAKYAGPGAYVTIHAVPARDGGVDIYVDDDGAGIAPTDHDAALAPFRRPGGDAQVALTDGVGLGLSLAQSIIRLHGGRLRLETPPQGRGLRVAIHLPRHASGDGATIA